MRSLQLSINLDRSSYSPIHTYILANSNYRKRERRVGKTSKSLFLLKFSHYLDVFVSQGAYNYYK